MKKFPIAKYILKPFIITSIIAGLLCVGGYVVLSITGFYLKVESYLDLKYNSPIVRYPLVVFALLAVLSCVDGLRLYFFKYKRKKSKTKFYQAVSVVFDTNKKGDKR